MANNTVYDPDADEHPVHHEVPSDEELRRLTGINEEQESAMDREAHSGAAADLAQKEGLFNPGGDTSDGSAASASELGAAEAEGGSLFKNEPAPKKKIRPGKKLSSRSNLKKRLAIAGAAAGGSVIVGVIAFFALLPLKIEGLVKNLESHYFATTQNAIDKETEAEFNQFTAKEVLPNFFTAGNCRTTADPSCVSVASGTGPVDRLFQAWKQGNLEQKLATQYGIVIQRKGATVTMTAGGVSSPISDSQFKSIQAGKSTIFDLGGQSGKSTNEVRTAVRNALKDATLYDKVYFRFKVGKLLESKYGIKRCVIACDVRDKFTDSVTNKKLAAKAYLVERVVSPFSDTASLGIQCILFGGCNTDNLTPSGDAEDPEKTSDFQKQINSKLATFAETYGSEKLTSLVESANAISEDGFSKWLFSKIVSNVAGDAAGDAAGELADGAGTVNFISQVVLAVNGASSDIKKVNYTIDAAAVVGTYMTFRTVTDEVHSGHMDVTELGSFSDELTNGNVDATSTPLYNSLLGNGSSSTATAFSNDPLLPHSYAATTASAPSNGNYRCQNGKPVPGDQKVCNEEVLNGGSDVANRLSSITNSIPLWGDLVTLANAWKDTAGKLFNAFGALTQYIPGISNLADLVGKATQPILQMITSALITNPLEDAVNANGGALPSGGRTFDLMAAGADVSGNKSCEVQLGCAEISPAQVAEIQNEQLQADQASFNHQSMFARMFDTSSQYSLVSRLAMDMPSSLTSASDSGLASLLSNPVSKLTSLFSSVFSSNHAFAANAPQADPFGVVQYGYTDSQIPSDPQAYWNQYCQGDFTTAWENSQQEDPNTGDAVATTSNACMLIQSSVQSAGGLDDPSLLPAGSQNP